MHTLQVGMASMSLVEISMVTDMTKSSPVQALVLYSALM
jgi:hypothetical protein